MLAEVSLRGLQRATTGGATRCSGRREQTQREAPSSSIRRGGERAATTAPTTSYGSRGKRGRRSA